MSRPVPGCPSSSPARARRAALAALVLLCPGAFAVQAPPAPAPVGAQAPQEGPRVLSIEVQGQRRYTAQQLVAALGQEVGQPLDLRRLGIGIDTLWDAFKVRADVKQSARSGGVDLLLVVSEMSFDLEPRFLGHKEIDLETLRRWAQLDEKSEMYTYQANRVRQRLIEGYRQEGYAFVEITIQKRDEDPLTGASADVIFEIVEGPQVRVQDVVVSGNRSLPDTGALWWKDGLKHLAKLELDGPYLLNLRGSKFDEEVLQADLLSMRNVYRDLGWLDVVVAEQLVYTQDRSGVTIRVRVDEGERYTVSKLAIRGVARTMPAGKSRLEDAVEGDVPLLFDESELLALCKLAPGRFYQRTRERADELALRGYYGERGYLAHPSLDPLDRFEFLQPPDLVFDTRAHSVEVTYKLQQGRKRYIREVLFSGGEFTRDRVLRREVDVMPGELADIREINRSLSRLYSTNYFNDDFRPLDHRDPTYRFLPTSDPDWVDLEYQVEEGRVVDFNLYGGVDSNNGLFGKLVLQMRNFDGTNLPSSVWSTFAETFGKQAFHGAGQTLNLVLSPGTLYDQTSLRFVEPDVFGLQFDRYSLDVELSTSTRLWRFYTENRDRTTVRVGREFGRSLTLFAGITAQAMDITDIEAEFSGLQQPDGYPLPRGIFEQAGESTLYGLLFDALYQDLDNRINPYEGVRVSWRNGYFGGPLGGDWQFLRSQLDVDAFFLAGEKREEGIQSGFHAAFGLGVADALGDTSSTPYTERFFLGGLGTVRGFANRGVGPNTGGEPDGGQTMVSASLEYRIPLLTQVQPGSYRELEVFRFLLFADAGILDPDSYSLDLDELRASAGFGIGMAYPIPLNFTFGFPLQSGEGDRKQVFGYSIAAFGF